MGDAMALHFFSRSSLYDMIDERVNLCEVTWDLSVLTTCLIPLTSLLSLHLILSLLKHPPVQFMHEGLGLVLGREVVVVCLMSPVLLQAREGPWRLDLPWSTVSISLRLLGFVLFDTWCVFLSGPLRDRLVCREQGCCSHQLARLWAISSSLYGMMNGFSWCWLCSVEVGSPTVCRHNMWYVKRLSHSCRSFLYMYELWITSYSHPEVLYFFLIFTLDLLGWDFIYMVSVCKKNRYADGSVFVYVFV